MVCPYAVHRVSLSKTKFEYDEENKETGRTTIDVNMAGFAPCLESECGAYNRTTNRCEYRG